MRIDKPAHITVILISRETVTLSGWEDNRCLQITFNLQIFDKSYNLFKLNYLLVGGREHPYEVPR